MATATSVQHLRVQTYTRMHTHAHARTHACDARTHTSTQTYMSTLTPPLSLSLVLFFQVHTHASSRSLVLSPLLASSPRTLSDRRIQTRIAHGPTAHGPSHTHNTYPSPSLTHIDEITYTRSFAPPLPRVPLQVTLSRSRSTRPVFVFQRLARARADHVIPIS